MLSLKPTHKPGIRSKQVGRETILYGGNAEAIHVLNPTAKLIWDLCDGAHTIEEIAESIRTHFSVPAGHDLVEDINNTINVFAQKGLMEDLTI